MSQNDRLTVMRYESIRNSNGPRRSVSHSGDLEYYEFCVSKLWKNKYSLWLNGGKEDTPLQICSACFISTMLLVGPCWAASAHSYVVRSVSQYYEKMISHKKKTWNCNFDASPQRCEICIKLSDKLFSVFLNSPWLKQTLLQQFAGCHTDVFHTNSPKYECKGIHIDTL